MGAEHLKQAEHLRVIIQPRAQLRIKTMNHDLQLTPLQLN